MYDGVSPSKKYKQFHSGFSTPTTRNRRTCTKHESYNEERYSTPSNTSSHRSSFVQLEIANTTPKSTKGRRLAIMHAQQEICLSGKDIQKSVKSKLPMLSMADTDRLKERQVKIAGPGQSLAVECPTEDASTEENGDLLTKMRNRRSLMVVKQIDASLKL